MKKIRISRYQIMFVFCIAGIFISTVCLIDNRKKASALREKISQRQKEINQKEALYQKRIKEFELLKKKRKEQTDKLKLEYKIK